MAKITLEEAPEFDVFPEETVLRVRVEENEIREFDGSNGKWEKLNFKFKVVQVFDPQYKHMEGIPIFGGVPFRLTDHEDNQLKQWVEALLGLDELGVGFELDTDDLVGREARAITGTYTKKGTTQVRHTVASLLPLSDDAGSVVGAGVAPEPEPAAATQSSFGTTVDDSEIPF